MAPKKRPDGMLAIEHELRSEKASALKRVGDRLEQLLAELRRLEARASGMPEIERRPLVAYHEELRREAERERWYLIVQREAVGIRNEREVLEFYPIPPRLGFDAC